MNLKRIIAIVLIVIGITCLFMAHYISKEIANGKFLLGHAKKTIATTDAVSSLNPVTKSFGKDLTGAGRSKIEAGEKRVAFYTVVEKWLKIGGIVVLAGGGALLLFGNMKRRSR